MPNYQQGKIYKIKCNLTGEQYFGSTCMKYLCNRKSDHNQHVKYFDEGKMRNKCASYDIIKRGDWAIVLVEDYPCDSKDALRARERYYIENNECVNKNRPIINEEEHKELKHKSYLKNLDKIKEKRESEEYKAKANARGKEIRATEEGKAKKAEADKKYRNGEHREELLQKKREYHHANKEAIAEKAKAYREANKEAIAERKRAEYEKAKEKGLCEQIVCQCGGNYILRAKARHFKTKCHQAYVNNSS
jgi:hypothetical protein